MNNPGSGSTGKDQPRNNYPPLRLSLKSLLQKIAELTGVGVYYGGDDTPKQR
ncbi:hypothetical protein U9M48_001634 [Paspalum notatum var. saurae]|uniref:Uncharacterized protein n=1 Tax=Paspalum notatum var. saurae TaxID=547442 RepID=A0AAQ3PNX6_PASNO